MGKFGQVCMFCEVELWARVLIWTNSGGLPKDPEVRGGLHCPAPLAAAATLVICVPLPIQVGKRNSIH